MIVAENTKTEIKNKIVNNLLLLRLGITTGETKVSVILDYPNIPVAIIATPPNNPTRPANIAIIKDMPALAGAL